MIWNGHWSEVEERIKACSTLKAGSMVIHDFNLELYYSFFFFFKPEETVLKTKTGSGLEWRSLKVDTHTAHHPHSNKRFIESKAKLFLLCKGNFIFKTNEDSITNYLIKEAKPEKFSP